MGAGVVGTMVYQKPQTAPLTIVMHAEATINRAFLLDLTMIGQFHSDWIDTEGLLPRKNSLGDRD